MPWIAGSGAEKKRPLILAGNVRPAGGRVGTPVKNGRRGLFCRRGAAGADARLTRMPARWGGSVSGSRRQSWDLRRRHDDRAGGAPAGQADDLRLRDGGRFDPSRDMGIEAVQSAFGDVYAWLKRFLIWPSEQFGDEQKREGKLSEKLLGELTRQAEARCRSALPALDWFNGRRYPYADEFARGAIAGLS